MRPTNPTMLAWCAVASLLAAPANAQDTTPSPIAAPPIEWLADDDIQRGAFACGPVAIPEGEPLCADEYQDVFNAGCNSLPNTFSDIALPVSICGAVGSFTVNTQDSRDTDWYRFNLSGRATVEITLVGATELDLYLLDLANVPNCSSGSDITFRALEVVAAGVPTTITADLPAGPHYVFVASPFTTGIPCDTAYQLDIGFPTGAGACCFGCDANDAVTECQVLTLEACCAAGGLFLGEDIGCANTAYLAGPCASAFEDISATGTNAGLFDEDNTLVPIGFVFEFYGQAHTSVSITDNGILTLAPPPATFDNQDIPDPAEPNSVIAPWWIDLDPGAGGAVYFQTLGAAPNRRFVAQWDSVPRFLNTDSNTFQAVLFEGSNRIEFRYGQLTDATLPTDATVGVESGSGSLAVNLYPLSIAPGACVELLPQPTPEPCRNLCRGDLNGDGRVDIFDFATLADKFGRLTDADRCDGDLTCDGLINSFDFAELAVKFGCQGVPFTPQCCQTTGACCLCDAFCLDNATLDSCNLSGGQFLGAGSVCALRGGCTPFGACCLPDASCADGLTEFDCIEVAGGVSWLECEPCEFTDCRIRSCCFADGSCLELIEFECSGLGGDWGLSETCALAECDQLGACCLFDGVCIDDLTQAACQQVGAAQSFNIGAACGEFPCLPIGACCYSSGFCTDGLTEDQCFNDPDAIEWTEGESCPGVGICLVK